ncbi:ORF118 [Infectious spleen and kidney necrosis virus]|nr:ORF118 [Infectious spleen and kidney necrosis virus]
MSVTSFLLALGDKIHCSAPMCGALGDLCVDRTICAKGDLRTMAREACALGTQHQFMVAMRHLDRKWLIDWWYAHLRRQRRHKRIGLFYCVDVSHLECTTVLLATLQALHASGILTLVETEYLINHHHAACNMFRVQTPTYVKLGRILKHKYDTHTANDIVRKVCLYYPK